MAFSSMTEARMPTYAKSESKLSKSEKDSLLALLAEKDIRLVEMQAKIQELEATRG